MIRVWELSENDVLSWALKLLIRVQQMIFKFLEQPGQLRTGATR